MGTEGGADLSTGTTGMSCSMGLLEAPIDALSGLLFSPDISCVADKGQPKPGPFYSFTLFNLGATS